MNSEYYMRMALDLAKKGMGYTSPNPMVGAVIVKNGKVIGKGYHHKYGDLHGERDALANATDDVTRATMYVTLEPCCHKGKQPPCVEAIIQAGIKKVFVGSDDPNLLVAGKGIKILQDNGIEVETHILKEECDSLNKVFFHYIQTKMPYVILKYAMTIDGKIATYTGESKWITGEKAREHVHNNRHRYSGIMVGVGTVLADNPMLTCRIPEGVNPTRIICDTNLRTPIESNIVQSAKDIPTIIATGKVEEEKVKTYERLGCKILQLPDEKGKVNLESLMKKLGEMNIDSVIVEGGGTLNWSMVAKGLVNKTEIYIAPKIFGGKDAKTPVEGQGFKLPAESLNLEKSKVSILGEDILIESYIKG